MARSGYAPSSNRLSIYRDEKAKQTRRYRTFEFSAGRSRVGHGETFPIRPCDGAAGSRRLFGANLGFPHPPSLIDFHS